MPYNLREVQSRPQIWKHMAQGILEFLIRGSICTYSVSRVHHTDEMPLISGRT